MFPDLKEPLRQDWRYNLPLLCYHLSSGVFFIIIKFAGTGIPFHPLHNLSFNALLLHALSVRPHLERTYFNACLTKCTLTIAGSLRGFTGVRLRHTRHRTVLPLQGRKLLTNCLRLQRNKIREKDIKREKQGERREKEISRARSYRVRKIATIRSSFVLFVYFTPRYNTKKGYGNRNYYQRLLY